MDSMIENLDKTYVMFVLEKLNITVYQLSKRTGISNATFSRLLAKKHSMTWSNIAKIEYETDIAFKSQEHLIFANELSFCPNSKTNKGTNNGKTGNKRTR